jgi:hypothetical protein
MNSSAFVTLYVHEVDKTCLLLDIHKTLSLLFLSASLEYLNMQWQR